MFTAVLDPSHRPSNLPREIWDQQIFRVDMALDAKASADVERHTANARLRQAEDRCGLTPHPMHDLCRRPDCHRIATRLVQGDNAAAFHRHGGVTVMIKAP